MSALWLILVIMIWGAVHSLFASLQAKAFVRRVLGPGADPYYRLGYNLFAALSLVPLLVLARLLADRDLYTVPQPWSVILVGGEVLAGVILVVGFLQSHPFDFLGIQRQVSPGQERGRLTTPGLYHNVRHPLCSAGLVVIWLVPRMTANLLVVNLALTASIAIGANLEERILRREYMQEFDDYMAVTPMFIPFLKGNKPRRGAS